MFEFNPITFVYRWAKSYNEVIQSSFVTYIKLAPEAHPALATKHFGLFNMDIFHYINSQMCLSKLAVVGFLVWVAEMSNVPQNCLVCSAFLYFSV